MACEWEFRRPVTPLLWQVFLLKGLLNEPSAIMRFSEEYVVKDHLVKNYVCHLEYLKFKKKNVKNQRMGFKEKKEAKRMMTTIEH